MRVGSRLAQTAGAVVSRRVPAVALLLHLPTVVGEESTMFTINRPSLRIALAVLISPLSAGVLLLVISLLGSVREGLWALRFSALVGYPTMLVLGLPAHLLLKQRKWTSLRTYMLAGLLVGVVVYAVLFSSDVVNNLHLAANAGKSLVPSAAILILVTFFGVLSSMVFWAIARPDR
jgi:hypothetical protein